MPSSATRLLATLFVGLLSASLTTAQDYSTTHNATSLLGTWSSGNGAVMTGSGFANPVNSTFTYPATTGISYSFTVEALSDGSDGYFEEALYRFQGNGSQPTCITGILQWQHGTYQLNTNGSIVLNPFAADGRQQVQDMCAAQSNIIQQFNQTTLFSNWNIYVDTSKGYKLQIYEFDGTPKAPMYLISTTPNMLPTEVLTNTTTSVAVVDSSASRKDSNLWSTLGVAGSAVAFGVLALL